MELATIERPSASVLLDNLGSYEQEINLFIKQYGRNFSFDNIERFIKEAISFETRNKRVKAFKRFYKNNITDNHLLNIKEQEINPLIVKMQDAPIELPITKKDCLDVIDYLNNREPEQGKNVDDRKYKRLSLIVKTLYVTGIRISELTGITYNHVKTNGVCKITVLGKGNKSRVVEIPMELYNDIRKIFSEKSDYLFHNSHGNKLQQSHLFKEIQKAYNREKKENEKIEVGLHTHRHLFATELIKAGVPINEVSKKLGHSSIAITAKFYLHNTTDSKDIFSKLGI